MLVLHRITTTIAYHRETLRLLCEHAEDTINRYLWLRLAMGLWIVGMVAASLVGMINYQHARIHDWLPAFIIFGGLYLVWAALATVLHIRNRRDPEREQRADDEYLCGLHGWVPMSHFPCSGLRED